MCLGVIGKLVSKDDETGIARIGEIDAAINLQFTPLAGVNDFVLIHAGFAIKEIDKKAARSSIRLLETAAKIQDRIEALSLEISDLAKGLRTVRLMEVCGTHTVAIARSGLKARLPDNVELISGPGCPVCVTPVSEIDMGIELALSRKATVISFGDMLRVPGSSMSLEEARAKGGRVSIVYSPRQALEMALSAPGKIVFLAVRFETTTPTIANVVEEANNLKLTNFSVLVSHRLIPPALEAILSDPACRLDALICPGHVSTIIGADAYSDVARKFKIPCVVTGFEPTDVLSSIVMILRQIREGRTDVENQYKRTVTVEGNLTAQESVAEFFEVTEASWRGVGVIENSGLRLKSRFSQFDAVKKFGLNARKVAEPAGCKCGAILAGRSDPRDCGLFGKSCTPDRPVGPCMVSSEGSCSAEFLYGGVFF